MSAPDRFDSASFWMPSYTHWKIPYSTRKFNAVPIPIVKVLLDQLRFLKHKDYDLLTQPRYPPLALPGSLLLRPQYWQTFWSLAIPSMAFTPWFRLLHGYIHTAALQHTWNPSVTTSPLCRLCQQRDVSTSLRPNHSRYGRSLFFGAGISAVWKYHCNCQQFRFGI
ncbi:hypothetical protein BCV71DRAFT_282245 [Rhizopus microsporus]|uniref:Uncharacterized protein n=1 Tax=Rhizopus microsporus TaxID=58291 RepID=A0A1X0S6S1_RHIZD|nr:hypothetical protein BCV71DRAFT_282245 [Rhizopus microsporus]